MNSTGIDILRENPEAVLKNRNIALITGSANIDSAGMPVYQVVKNLAGQKLKALWSLQHGFFLDKQDNMILSDSFFWKDFEIEVNSLYGENLLPRQEWLQGLDALLVDVFDIGSRVYTFLNHLVLLLKSLSGQNITFIILDRPNPLNGLHLEGSLLKEDYLGIAGQLPAPMRHGLTAGEFLGYALSHHDIDLELEIVKVKNWRRQEFFSGTWTYPSPNMPTFNTALVYPGAVMLEGSNISEGRGTTRPFEFVGTPYIDNFKLVKELKNLGLPGVDYIPIFFKPEFSKYRGEVCKGILVAPTNIQEFQSFATYYEITRLIKVTCPDKFQWKAPPYEFEYERPPMDMICGSPFIRQSIEDNLPFTDIQPQIDMEIQQYRSTIEPFLLY